MRESETEMNSKFNDPASLRLYLLGNLDDAAQARIETRLMTDEQFGNEISAAEEELIEDFLEGALTPVESRLFNSHFLTSDVRKAQLREISLLKSYVKDLDLRERRTDPVVDSRGGFIDSLKAYMRPLLLGSAGLAILLIGGLIWSGYFRGPGSALEKEYSDLNKADLSNLSELSRYSTVNLSSGSFRNGDSLSRQTADRLTDTVLFRLALPSKFTEGSTIKAKISRGPVAVFTIESSRVYGSTVGQEVRLLVPKSILQKGQYQISVDDNSGAEVGTFAFVIE